MFHFRLDKVLRHRKRIVDEEARKLQSIAVQIGRLETVQRSYRRDVAAAGEAAQACRAGSLDIRFERVTDDFIRGRRLMVAALERDKQDLQRRFEAQRLILVSAQRDVSVLERLQESQRESWRRDERRRDQKRSDEVAGRMRSFSSGH